MKDPTIRWWKAVVYCPRIVCMWSYQPWYPDLDEHSEIIQPVRYHKELQWPIHVGICWIPNAGNFCIDLFAWRIFLSIDPFWKREKSWEADIWAHEAKEIDAMRDDIKKWGDYHKGGIHEKDKDHAI